MRSTLLGPTAMLATIAVLASACGGSSDGVSGGQADGDGFCEQIVALEAAPESLEGDNIDDASLDALRSLRDAAPDELRDDMIVFIDVFEKLADIDENDPASAEEAFALLFDPAVIAAGENLEAYGVSECGLPPSSGTDSGIDSTTDSSVNSGTATAGLDDALYDPNFDDPVDPSEASIDGLQLYLDENYPDAEWRPKLSSFAQFGDDLQAGGIEVEADAIAICDALLAYAAGFSADATVGVTTFADYLAEEISVATGDTTDGCVTV
jgi:hypothetical protein